MSTLLGRWTFILLCALCWLTGNLAGLRPLLLLLLTLNPEYFALSPCQCPGNNSAGSCQAHLTHTAAVPAQDSDLQDSRTSSSIGEQGLLLHFSEVLCMLLFPSLSWSLRTGKLALTHQVCLCPELLHSPGVEFQNSKAFSALYRKSLPSNWACGADPKWQKGQVKTNRNIRGMKPSVNIAQYSLTPTLPSLFLHLRPCE